MFVQQVGCCRELQARVKILVDGQWQMCLDARLRFQTPMTHLDRHGSPSFASCCVCQSVRQLVLTFRRNFSHRRPLTVNGRIARKYQNLAKKSQAFEGRTFPLNTVYPVSEIKIDLNAVDMVIKMTDSSKNNNQELRRTAKLRTDNR